MMAYRLKHFLNTAIGPQWGPWLVFFASVAAYLPTLGPGLGPIDSGELAVVCQTLGIAHPTGYPLYTLLGRLWAMAFPWGELAWRLNLLSALMMAASASMLFRLLGRLRIRTEAALAGSLAYAFSPVIWSQAVFLEVYALTAMWSVAVLWLAVAYRQDGRPRQIMLIAFLAGLGMGNHLSLLWTLGGVAILLAVGRIRPWLGLAAAGLFLTGISVYLFLPVRSNLSPLMNWGSPGSWERFLWHVSGRQYRTWMFGHTAGQLWLNFKNFLALWLKNPGIYLWWLIIPGVIAMYRKDRRVLLALGSVFLLAVLYGINYSIPDIDPYFIPALVSGYVLMAAGTGWLAESALPLIPWPRLAVLSRALVAGVSLLPLVLNFTANDQSHNRLSEDLASALLESAEPNAVILVDNWDLYSPCLYLVHHQGLRRDVVLVNKELLRRSWYLDHLKKLYPAYLAACQVQVERYQARLSDFEHGRPYDVGELQSLYQDLINALLLNNYYDNPPYLTQPRLLGDYDRVAVQYLRVPEGLLYRLKLPGSVENIDDRFLFSDRLAGIDTLKLTPRERHNYRLWPRMLYSRGLYLAQNLLYDDALGYFQQAVKYESYRPEIYLALGGAYTGLSRLPEAKEAFQQVLKLEPGNQTAIENLRRISMFLPGGPKGMSVEMK